MEEILSSETAYEPMFSDYPEIVTVKEISEMLGLHKNKVYDLIKEGVPLSRGILDMETLAGELIRAKLNSN